MLYLLYRIYNISYDYTTRLKISKALILALDYYDGMFYTQDGNLVFIACMIVAPTRSYQLVDTRIIIIQDNDQKTWLIP